jgi:hypothetical protein
VAEQLLASHEGLSSIELVGWLVGWSVGRSVMLLLLLLLMTVFKICTWGIGLKWNLILPSLANQYYCIKPIFLSPSILHSYITNRKNDVPIKII